MQIYIKKVKRTLFSQFFTERHKQKHNTPMFCEDNSSLTLGRDGKYYFCFILPEELVKQLPDRLVHQALAIAQKVECTIIKPKGRKGLVGK
jgi:hypothetical protein